MNILFYCIGNSINSTVKEIEKNVEVECNEKM